MYLMLKNLELFSIGNVCLDFCTGSRDSSWEPWIKISCIQCSIFSLVWLQSDWSCMFMFDCCTAEKLISLVKLHYLQYSWFSWCQVQIYMILGERCQWTDCKGIKGVTDYKGTKGLTPTRNHLTNNIRENKTMSNKQISQQNHKQFLQVNHTYFLPSSNFKINKQSNFPNIFPFIKQFSKSVNK